MTFTAKNYAGDLLFVPLGGTNEIGMNLNLYHYKGKWIIIDLGIGFADDYLPGIEILLPDIAFIHEIKPDILGLVLTHAHEDHLGAVPYLWEEIGCPIYATPFTASVLSHKLAEEGLRGRVPVHEVKPGGSFDLGPFALDLVDLTHSIPEMQAIAIRTDLGTIIHTGDWKLDPIPLVGPVSNEEALRQYGRVGPGMRFDECVRGRRVWVRIGGTRYAEARGKGVQGARHR
jgi:ribonuclease J